MRPGARDVADPAIPKIRAVHQPQRERHQLMRKYRKRLIAAAVVTGLLATGGYAGAADPILGPATATTVDQKVMVQIAPKRLPKNKWTPGSLRVRTEAHFPAGEPRAPITDRVKVKIDKNVRVNTKGLPTCRPNSLQNTDEKVARRKCKKAIVGKGKARAWVAMPDSLKIPAPAPVTVFNGTPVGKKPVFLIHAYTTVPVPTTFVVPGVYKNIKGPYGYELNFQVPAIAGGYGSLDYFDTKVGHSWRFKGKKQHYGYGRCRTGKFRLQADFWYRTTTADDLPGPSLKRSVKTTTPCKG